MIIKELTVEAFRGLADGTYELPEGLTIVRGPNEVGKSTFQMAILTALFGDPTSSAQQWKRLHRWNAGRKLRVELVFEEDGEGWELVRDFETGKSQLKNLQTGELTDGRDAVDEKLQEVAPVTTESVYNATACLHQQDLAGLQAGGELRDMLSRSMTGGADEAAASQVSRIIGSEISSTYTKGRRGGDPGLYQGLKRTLQELKDKQERITQEAEKTQEARQFIAEHEDEFERLQQDLENRQKLFERVS
ncbi:MAG: AAA family ATPase, partial [Armatimonadota bacterium]